MRERTSLRATQVRQPSGGDVGQAARVPAGAAAARGGESASSEDEESPRSSLPRSPSRAPRSRWRR
eukprot:3918356-Alexandrium_andersonii.AAC.1